MSPTGLVESKKQQQQQVPSRDNKEYDEEEEDFQDAYQDYERTPPPTDFQNALEEYLGHDAPPIMSKDSASSSRSSTSSSLGNAKYTAPPQAAVVVVATEEDEAELRRTVQALFVLEESLLNQHMSNIQVRRTFIRINKLLPLESSLERDTQQAIRVNRTRGPVAVIDSTGLVCAVVKQGCLSPHAAISLCSPYFCILLLLFTCRKTRKCLPRKENYCKWFKMESPTKRNWTPTP
jgi:hypothetical protein